MRQASLKTRLQHMEKRRSRDAYQLEFANGSSISISLTTRQQLQLLFRAMAHRRAEIENYGRAHTTPFDPPADPLDRWHALQKAVRINPMDNGPVATAWRMVHETHEEHLTWLHERGCHKGMSEKELEFCGRLPKSEATPDGPASESTKTQ